MNVDDIQGLVLQAYRSLPHASYVLMRFTDSRPAARAWLAKFADGHRIDDARRKETGPPGSPTIRVNIALTYTGLERLGVDQRVLETFPPEFVEGLGRPWIDDETPDHRSRILGDVDDSAPSEWAWGVQDAQRRVDVLLLAFARDPVHLEEQVEAWIAEGVADGAIERRSARTEIGRLPDNPSDPPREPFGFIDGISQPVLSGAARELRPGARRKQPAMQEIDDGEIVLGYRDGARQIAPGPWVPETVGGGEVLPEMFDKAADGSKRFDLGINGTYLVFRKLSQNVAAFQAACAAAADELKTTAEHAAALMVGRWQDGSPLMRAPLTHDRQFDAPPAANDFTYASDPHGERCPMGAHIRRANPRDSLGDDPGASLAIVNRHRILRRGRRYGPGGIRPLGGAGDSTDVGLHFICLNASIARQFEFVQQNWINASTFNGLDREDDPLLGCRAGTCESNANPRFTPFTAPPPPEHRMPRRVARLERLVTVKGGGYFFLPSLTALRYLSAVAPPRRRPIPVAIDQAPPTRGDRIRALVLARFSVLSAVLLACLPLGASPIGGRIAASVGANFDLDHPWEMAVVAALASLAATAVMLTFRVVHLYARVRFDVNVSAPLLTWRVVLLWQGLSLPLVLAALSRSALDAAFGGEPYPWIRFGIAALAGYAAAFLIVALASAARGAAVRADNPQSAVLLPLSERLERWTRRVSLAEGAAKKLVELIESRLGMLSEDVGVGYVDHRTGRLLPGHVTTLTFAATLALLYVTGWYLLKPPGRAQLPPLAYILFLLMMSGLASAVLSFWLDRHRVPLLTLMLAWFAIASWVGGTDHQFDAPQALAARAPPTIVSAAEHADRHYGIADGPIVVVAAAGGGIRQAVWTARVLTGLAERFGREFTTRVRLVSGVSAGAVGALHFVKEYTRDAVPGGNLARIVAAAARPASGDIWWGLAYPDALRGIVGFPPPRLLARAVDRGWALQAAWSRALDFKMDGGPTLNTWREDVGAGWRPAFAFNATVVETGERAVFATYAIPSNTTSDAAARSLDGRDLPLLTAARLSAAFPYVTPVARRRDSTGDAMVHFADGGYWDNSGVATALDWLTDARDFIGARPVIVVQIAPAIDGEQSSARDRAWVWQFAAPLATLFAVRSAAQQAHIRFETDMFRVAWPGGALKFVTIADRGDNPTVGWHLSRRERREIDDAWARVLADGDGPLATIAAVLSPTAAAADGGARD